MIALKLSDKGYENLGWRSRFIYYYTGTLYGKYLLVTCSDGGVYSFPTDYFVLENSEEEYTLEMKL